MFLKIHKYNLKSYLLYVYLYKILFVNIKCIAMIAL